MPDRVSTIRFKVEGTQQVTSKISELNREAVRQQRDLARSLAQVQKEQNGGIDPTETIRRAKSDALRLGNIRAMQVKEQADLQQRELASSRTQLANIARLRAADYKKQQEAFGDAATARLSSDDKADRTLISRRQKRNEAEHKLMMVDRERVKRDRLADLNDFIGREDAKAKAFEDGQKKLARAAAKAKRESMGGALSGFGGKMILGMAAGRLAGDVMGSGIGGLAGTVAGGFMFGGPAVGAAIGGMELLGTAISATRQRQEQLTNSVRDYYSELGKLVSREQEAAKSVLPVTKVGAGFEEERQQLFEQRAEKAEAHRREVEDAKTTWSGWFKLQLRMMNSRQFLGEEGMYYREQKESQEREDRLQKAYEGQRQLQTEINRADRASSVARSQIAATVPGFKRTLLDDQLDEADQERRITEAGEQDKILQNFRHAEAIAAAQKLHQDTTELEKSQGRERVALEKEIQEQLEAVRVEAKNRQKARATDFIYSENERLNPIFQLNEYNAKLKDAVDKGAETIDGARLKLQHKVTELYGSVLHPGDFRVVDSRSRINLAALNPMVALAQAGQLKGTGIPGYADGTDNHPGGLAMVGERGPEIVRLPKGSGVVPIPNYDPRTAAVKDYRLHDPRIAPIRQNLAHAGFINGVPASKYHKAAPEGGLINGVRADEMLRESSRRGNELGAGSAHLIDPRHRGLSQAGDLYGARASRWTAPTGTGREMGNSAAFNEWAKSHPLHSYHPKAQVFGPPIPSAVKKGLAGVPSQYHKLFGDDPAGYYQPHGMLARVKASQAHAKANAGPKTWHHGMIDPLTGRELDPGTFSAGDARGTSPAGSMAMSDQLLQGVRQIIQILQTQGVN